MKKTLICILIIVFAALSLASCGKAANSNPTVETKGSMELEYASQFSVDYYESGCALITIGGEDLPTKSPA